MALLPAGPLTAADLFRLDGRVAIVTGASSGLGARFAETLSGAGAAVVVTARRGAELSQLADRLPDVLAVPADLRSGADRRAGGYAQSHPVLDRRTAEP